MRPTRLLAPLLVLVFATAAPARDRFPDDVVLQDAIEVLVLGRELHAIDAEGSGRLILRLEKGEEILWSGARGRVAVAISNRRLLGATPVSSQWQEERIRLIERPPPQALISERAALVVTRVRALAFGGGAASWIDVELGPNEAVRARRVGPGTGLVVTDRRALGFSSRAGAFFSFPLRVGEALEGTSAGSSVATVTTSQRVLTFRAPTGSWGARSRPIE